MIIQMCKYIILDSTKINNKYAVTTGKSVTIERFDKLSSYYEQDRRNTKTYNIIIVIVIIIELVQLNVIINKLSN